MYYYFSCTHPAVLKINGIYFGEIHNDIKFINIENDNSFVEICSIANNIPNINFILNKDFINSNRDDISITDMKGGYLIKILPHPAKINFTIYNQKKFANALFTAFGENGNSLSIETQNDFFVDNIDFNFSSVDFFPFNNHPNLFISRFNGNKTLVNIYKTDKIEKLYSFICDEFDNYSLSFTTKIKDMEKHVIKKSLSYEKNSIVEKNIEIIKEKPLSLLSVNPKLIPYIFLENYLVNDKSYLELLSPDIKENASKLRDYFLYFLGIMPPPFFRQNDEIGLIYKESQNRFFVNYFTFTISNDKICNIVKLDN